jgi:heme/copper-type cytochrome/quinol oxidase subunit 2
MRASFSQIFDPASSQAVAISDLFKVVMIICAVILLIVASMIGISLIRFRYRQGTIEPRPFFGNRKLENHLDHRVDTDGHLAHAGANGRACGVSANA